METPPEETEETKTNSVKIAAIVLGIIIAILVTMVSIMWYHHGNKVADLTQQISDLENQKSKLETKASDLEKVVAAAKSAVTLPAATNQDTTMLPTPPPTPTPAPLQSNTVATSAVPAMAAPTTILPPPARVPKAKVESRASSSVPPTIEINGNNSGVIQIVTAGDNAKVKVSAQIQTQVPQPTEDRWFENKPTRVIDVPVAGLPNGGSDNLVPNEIVEYRSPVGYQLDATSYPAGMVEVAPYSQHVGRDWGGELYIHPHIKVRVSPSYRGQVQFCPRPRQCGPDHNGPVHGGRGSGRR